MSFKAMLDRVGIICRVTAPVDDYGTPQAPALTDIDRVPCAVSRQTISSVQGAPMVASEQKYRLYFMPHAPIREGDLVEVPGVGKFRLAKPYCPRGHHLEVDGAWEGEA